MSKLISIFLFLYTLSLTSVYAQAVFVIDSIKEEYQLKDEHILIYEDKTNNLTIQNISKKSFSSLKQLPIAKRKQNYTYWFRQTIINKSHKDLSLIFIPSLDRKDSCVYYISFDNQHFQLLTDRINIKHSFNSSAKGNKGDNRILIPKSQPTTIYIKIKFYEHIGYAGILESEENYFNDELLFLSREIRSYPLYGILCLIVFYSCILYAVLRDKTFLFYGIYISLLFIKEILRMLGVLVSPIFESFEEKIMFLPMLSPFFYLHFIRLFVNTKSFYKWDKILDYWLYIILITSPFILLDTFYYEYVYEHMGKGILNVFYYKNHLFIGRIMTILSVLITYFVSLSIIFWIKNRPIIIIFTFGNLFATMLPIINILLPISISIHIPTYEIAMIGQATIFTIGLGYRLKFVEDEKRKTQEENIKLQQEISQQLEEKNEELAIQNELIINERQKSEELLLNILPTEVAEELKEKGYTEVRHYANTSVLFADVKGFSALASKVSPQELIKELDETFTKMDEIIAQNNLERIKTIGDCYMCAGGVPLRNTTNALDITLAALAIQDWMNEERIRRNGNFWQVRLGIHSGELVAGVIGKTKFAYDVWGNTVNIASRMESGGEVEKVNISETTYLIIKDFFDFTPRGAIEAKNIGMIETYFVDRIKIELSENQIGKTPNELFFQLKKERFGV